MLISVDFSRTQQGYSVHVFSLYYIVIDLEAGQFLLEVLWATMRKYNIDANIIRVIENLTVKGARRRKTEEEMGRYQGMDKNGV